MPLCFRLSLFLLICHAAMVSPIVALEKSAPLFTPTGRGVTLETNRYRATIENGALVLFFNKFTSEEYLNGFDALAPHLPHLPSGVGNQNGEAALESDIFELTVGVEEASG